MAAGCILEIGETSMDLKRWVRLKKGLPVEEENAKSSWVLVGAIGLMLVILGVVGEGVFEGLSYRAETTLREYDSKILAGAVTKSGEAKDSASKASDASVRAKAAADAANQALDEAQMRVEAVEKEADIVQYVLSARHIDDEKGIANDLRANFKGSHIVFASYWDEESMWLCGQLTKIADKAEVGPINKCGDEPLIPGRPQVEDLYLEGPDHEQLEHLARILKASPNRIPGIFVGMREQPTLKVLVGLQRKIWLAHKLKQAAPQSKTNAKR